MRLEGSPAAMRVFPASFSWWMGRDRRRTTWGALPVSSRDAIASADGPAIVYTERVCPVCGEAVNEKQTYDKDACRKRAGRRR
jgi:hypothetical protein